MDTIRRVRDIAKDLDIPPKAILDRCIIEGIEGVETEFSPVMIGLEMTLAEWFSNERSAE